MKKFVCSFVFALLAGIVIQGESIAGKIYWTEYTNIGWSNLDGSNVETLAMGLGNLAGMAIDASNKKMYVADFGAEKILRADLCGLEMETFMPGLQDPWDIALDIVNNKIYFTDQVTRSIHRASLVDGSQFETLLTETSGAPRGFDLDLNAAKIYWANNGANRVKRANLDGAGVEDIAINLPSVDDVAIDPMNGKV